MNKGESFREYFRRARSDAGVRAQLLANARCSRTSFGVLACVFALLAAGLSAYGGILHGHWLPRAVVLCAFSCVVSVLIHDKFGDRILCLLAFDDAAPSDSPPTKPGPHSP